VIQGLRGLAVSFAVLFHLAKWEAIYWGDHRMLGPIERFGFAGVDMFFVISGFIITWTNIDHLGRPGKAPMYVARRLWRVYPTYWVAWIACVAVVYWITPDWSTVLPPGEWRTFFLWPGDVGGGGPPVVRQLPPAWSLVYEMIFYALFAVFLVVPKRFFVPALLAWATTAWLQAVYPIPLLTSFSGRLLYPLNIEFVLGCLGAVAVRRGVRDAHNLLAIAGIGLFVIGASIVPHPDLYPLRRVYSFGIGSALLVAGLAGGELRGGWSAPNWLARLGDASYSTFLAHWPTFILLSILIPQRFSSPPPRPLWLLVLIAFLQGSGFVLHRLVEQPLNGLGAKWFSSHRVAAREPIAAPNPTEFESPLEPQSGFFSQSR
jgi:peptidoglycan/LPS O-acetylase OafA/YrhL